MLSQAADTFVLATILGTDISSRQRSGRIREEIRRTTDLGNRFVVVDFAGVRSITEGACDELFAVLAVQRGLEWFRYHIRIINAAEFHKAMICSAYVHRALHEAERQRLTP